MKGAKIILKKGKYITTLLLSLSGILVLAGCQNTPDKNAVVSKVDGLSKDVLEKPLESGETNIVDLPKTWMVVLLQGLFRANPLHYPWTWGTATYSSE